MFHIHGFFITINSTTRVPLLTYLLTYLLTFPLAFPIMKREGLLLADMTDDLSSPHRPVRLLARSQSSTLQISLACVFPSVVLSSFSLVYLPSTLSSVGAYVFAMPVPDQSSLSDLFENLRHSCCSSDVFIPDLVFACPSAHPS